MNIKGQIFLIAVVFLMTAGAAYPEPSISVLWEKDIEQADRGLAAYTVQVQDETIVRVIGVSHTPRTKENPKAKDPKLFEYRLNLRDDTSEMKILLPMNEEDIVATLPEGGVLDSRLVGDDIVILRGQYKSHDFQELMIGENWQVKTRELPGLTRLSVSTHGACKNRNGEVFLCGNSGYIRKINSDGTVAWDTNYKSDKEEDGTLGVAFSESENVLATFGISFTSDTKFTTKNSSLWLANLDSEGHFKAKTEFEGIANFGKFPAFCLSPSDHPVVIYDTNAELKRASISVSRFSKDLNRKIWTTPLFEGEDTMIAKISLVPFGEDSVLAAIDSLVQNHVTFRFYILDKNGVIVNQRLFEDAQGTGHILAVSQDKIFLVSLKRRFENEKPFLYAQLSCYKINP
jgi:hypothetical protein